MSAKLQPPNASEMSWVLADTAVAFAACDRVFGITSMLLASGAAVCWLSGDVGGLTVLLMFGFPILNLTLSSLAHGGRRMTVEAVRLALNLPLVGVIYGTSDGVLHGMWLPMLVMVTGNALTWPLFTRKVVYGYAITLLNAGVLGVTVAIVPELDSIRALWQAVALIMAGFVLSTISAQLGGAVIEARSKRNEAEESHRELEQSHRELDDRNRGMRLVLDNVAQGFITIDVNGVMASEYSAIVDRWFGTPRPGATFSELIAAEAPDTAEWFELGMESVRDGYLPLALSLDQLPKQFVARDLTFSNQYTAILRDGELERILVIVTDVTDHMVRERNERDQRELFALFQRITEDRAGFDEFMDESSALVASLATPADLVIERRVIHTLKGNCAIYGCESVVELCHTLESELADTNTPLDDRQRHALTERWTKLATQLARLVGERPRGIEIDHAELASVVDEADRGAPGRQLASALAEWRHERVARRFERLGRYATSLARRLGKGEIELSIAANGIRLDTSRWSPLWGSLVHTIRNAVDHGIEGPDGRTASGKPARPTLSLVATRDAGYLTISVSDDGKGIDWELVRERACALGLPAGSQAELELALFTDGLSTRSEASDTSGRGVGLAALRSTVRALGGSIEIDSRPGHGTTFHCRFVEHPVEGCQLAS